MMNQLAVVMALTVAGTLLTGCAAFPARQSLAIQPVLRISHSPEQTAESWYQLGKYHQQRGELDLAIKAYGAAIALDGRQLAPHNAQATVFALQGRLAKAQQTLLRLMDDFPEAAHLHNNLGYVYLLQRDYAAARNALKRALALNAGDERARNNLAAVETSAGLSAGAALASASVPTTATISAMPAVLPAQPEPRMELVLIEPHVYQLKLIAAPASGVKTPSEPPRVAIVNGNGVTGMALQVKQLLVRRGIAVSRLGNARPYRQQQTEIQYTRGLEKEALALNHALKGVAVLVRRPYAPARPNLQLVLGKDAALALALRTEFAHALAAN
jgi:Flp pilus assembly protein TadD